jgi:hypothetical protein
MQRIKLGFTAHVSNFISAVFGAVIMLAFLACAQAQPTNRDNNGPSKAYYLIGFRCVRRL